MKRILTGEKAISMLNGNTEVDVDRKVIVNHGGFQGLRACAAFDFLVNHYGYIGLLQPARVK